MDLDITVSKIIWGTQLGISQDYTMREINKTTVVLCLYSHR